ncbi:kinase-like domain-containing protein, partial [Mycena rebaudengoi]
YDGWVSEVISPLREFIDGPINPRDYYLDLQEISESSGGSIIYVARLAESNREHLRLPRRVKEKDHSDVISRRTTFVAIKSIPIMPTGSSKLAELLRELCFMRDLSSDHLVGMDALYLDPIDDALWIRMELMTRSLSSVVQLNSEGLVLADRQISACTRDILYALEYLRNNRISYRNLRSDDVLINPEGVLKLSWDAVSNFHTNDDVPTDDPPDPGSSEVFNLKASLDISLNHDVGSIGAIVWEMAEGKRPSIGSRNISEAWPPLATLASRTPQFHQFLRTCFEPTFGRRDYKQLLETPFIQQACERSALAQLLLQCTAFEGRFRDNRCEGR